MNVRWSLALSLSLILAAPGAVLAQEGEKPPTEKSEEAPSDADKAKAEAEKKAKEAEEAKKKAEEKAAEAEEKAEGAEEKAAEAEAKAEDAKETVEEAAESATAEDVKAEAVATEEQVDAEKAKAEAEAAAAKAEAEAKMAEEKAAAEKAAAETKAKEAAELEKTMKESAAKTAAESKTTESAATTGAAAAGSTSDAAAGKDAKADKDDKSKANAAAALGAGMAVDASKPWLVSATFEQTLGQSVFLQDQQLRRAAYGYAVFASGSYDLLKVGEGVVRATARIAADQQLTNTANSAGTGPRQFFFRDIIVGLSGIRLYKEKTTGIIFNGRLSFTLPTSLQAQAAERWLTVGAGGSMMKTFADLGPGNLTLIGRGTVSKTVAPAKPTSDLAFCDSISAADNGVCFSSLTNPSFSLIYGMTAVYGIGSFNVALGLTIINAFRHDQNESTAATGVAADPSSSPFANPNVTANLATTTWATIQASYVLTANWSIGAGWSTIQSPIFQSGTNPKAIKFPFWNFQDPAYNASVFFFDLNYIY